MDEENKIVRKLELPVAAISLIAGIISIVKDLAWYIYSPLFALGVAGLIYILFFKKKNYSNFIVERQDIIIDIRDSSGNLALYTNTSLLKAIKNHAQNFQYTYYLDGVIRDLQSPTGTVGDSKIESGKIHIATSLRNPLQRGKEYEHVLKFSLNNTFLNAKEYWEMGRYTPGTKVTIKFLFPVNRGCQDYKAYKKNGAKLQKCEKQPILTLENGRPSLIFHIKNAKLTDSFRIEWTW